MAWINGQGLMARGYVAYSKGAYTIYPAFFSFANLLASISVPPNVRHSSISSPGGSTRPNTMRFRKRRTGGNGCAPIFIRPSHPAITCAITRTSLKVESRRLSRRLMQDVLGWFCIRALGRRRDN